MLNLPIHILSQVFHNRVTGFISFCSRFEIETLKSLKERIEQLWFLGALSHLTIAFPVSKNLLILLMLLRPCYS